jgi:hypothetical protein
MNCKKERLDSPTQRNGNILLRHSCMQHYSRTNGSRIPYSSRANSAIKKQKGLFCDVIWLVKKRSVPELKVNVTIRVALNCIHRAHHHTLFASHTTQSTSSPSVKRTIRPRFSVAFPEIRLMSRLILSPILLILFHLHEDDMATVLRMEKNARY